MAARECHSTDFDSITDVWFGTNDDTFVCRHEVDASAADVQFMDIFFKIYWPSMIWGAGTAIGEIPPYWLSRAARLAGKEDEEFEEMMGSQSKFQLLNRMRDWMVDFLQRHGFIGVLLMSAWYEYRVGANFEN